MTLLLLLSLLTLPLLLFSLLTLLLLALLLVSLLLFSLLALLLALLLAALLTLLIAAGLAFKLIRKLTGLTLKISLAARETIIFAASLLTRAILPGFSIATLFKRVLGIIEVLLLVTAEALQALELLSNIADRIGLFPDSLRLVFTLENQQDPLQVFLGEDLLLESIFEGLLLEKFTDLLQPRDDLQLAAAIKSLLQSAGLFKLFLLGEKLTHQGDQAQKTPLNLCCKLLFLAIELNRIFRRRRHGRLNT
ncbi:MAG: hypothetical protein MK479_01110 [Planctomycetes bacterium]|nr:hypothetical protein [Planctomycetota bacterium]